MRDLQTANREAIENDDRNQPPEPIVGGKRLKRPEPRKKRRYIAELAELQTRVDMALRMLARALGKPNQDPMRELVEVAKEMLEGKT